MQFKFKAGDRVRFVPKFGTYDKPEYARVGYTAVVLDESDIPTIQFISKRYNNQVPRRTAALQEDLVAL